MAFLAFPEAFRAHLASGVTTINLKTVSFNAEIIAQLILDGRAEEIVEKEKGRWPPNGPRCTGGCSPTMTAARVFQVLPLRKGWTGSPRAAARERGVHLLASRRFAVGARRPEAFARLAISSPAKRGGAEPGLRTVKELLEEGAGARGGLDILV